MNNLAQLRPLDHRTVNNITARIAPETSKAPIVKNARRVQATTDPFNYISQCCMNLMGLITHCSVWILPTVHYQLMCTILMRHHLNKNGKIAVFGPKGAKAE